MRKVGIIIFILILLGILVGCTPISSGGDESKEHEEILYELAKEVGYKKSFEEWVEKYYKAKIPYFKIKNLDNLYFNANGISFAYFEKDKRITNVLLTSLEDIIESSSENEERQVRFKIEDYIIKYRYEDEREWKDITSLYKLAFPLSEPEFEVEFNQTVPRLVFVKYEKKYETIANFNSLIEEMKDLRISKDLGKLNINEELEVAGCTLIPQKDYGYFVIENANEYTISSSNDKAKIKIINKETEEEHLATGSITLFLEMGEYYLYIETLTYADYCEGSDVCSIKIETTS